MILTTTKSVEGYVIEKYFQPIESLGYSSKLIDCVGRSFKDANEGLISQAEKVKADAVIGITYQRIKRDEVYAFGTPVKLQKI